MKTEELGKTDITNDIEKKSVDETLNGILETKWQKNCPKCGRVQLYSHKKTFQRALRINKCCRKCNHVGTTGKKMSNEQKKKISDHHKITGVGKWMFGRHLTEETKIKIGNKLKGRKLSAKQIEYLSKINTGKKHSLETRMKISKAGIGRKCSNETRDKLRVKAIENIENRHKNFDKWSPCYNQNACRYFDSLNKQTGWSLQHAENGGEIKVGRYWLDAYDKVKNIAVEYDELHHYNIDGNLRKNDIWRMEYIKEKLKCKFYRYNESKQLLYDTDFGQIAVV